MLGSAPRCSPSGRCRPWRGSQAAPDEGPVAVAEGSHRQPVIGLQGDGGRGEQLVTRLAACREAGTRLAHDSYVLKHRCCGFRPHPAAAPCVPPHLWPDGKRQREAPYVGTVGCAVCVVVVVPPGGNEREGRGVPFAAERNTFCRLQGWGRPVRGGCNQGPLLWGPKSAEQSLRSPDALVGAAVGAG